MKSWYGDEWIYSLKSENLLQGDSLDDLNITIACNATKFSPVGNYELSGTSSTNKYEVEFVVANLEELENLLQLKGNFAEKR